jgi:hypothetical protein
MPDQPAPTAASERPTRAPLIVLLIVIVAVVAFIGFFHVVQSSDGIALIPKEHFSFSLSFTSVDEVLSRHNSAGPFSRDPLLEHLVDELEHRGTLYSPAKRQFEQSYPHSSSSTSTASNVPADCYFNTPGDVSVVTDSSDYRLQLAGGFVGSEVFPTKQAAIDYIYQMHKIMHPAEGKNYQPAP